VQEIGVCEPMKENNKKGFDEWEIRNAHETLTRSEEIKANPKLLEAVKKYIEDQEAIKKKVAAQVGAAETLYGKKEQVKDASKSN